MSTKNILTTLLLLTLPGVSPLLFSQHFSQENMVEVHEHLYENVHMISYPIKESSSNDGEFMVAHRYEFEVFPGGYVSDIYLSIEDCDKVSFLEDGSIKITGPKGSRIEQAPFAYQEMPNGDIQRVNVSFRHEGSAIYLEVDDYEIAQVLTIEMETIQHMSSEMNSAAPHAFPSNLTNTDLVSYLNR